MQNEIIQLLHVVLGVLLLPRRSLFRNNPCTLRCFVRCGSDLHDARRANHCLSRVVEPLVVVLNCKRLISQTSCYPRSPFTVEPFIPPLTSEQQSARRGMNWALVPNFKTLLPRFFVIAICENVGRHWTAKKYHIEISIAKPQKIQIYLTRSW